MALIRPENTSTQGFSTSYQSTNNASQISHSNTINKSTPPTFTKMQCETVFECMNKIVDIFLEVFPNEYNHARLFVYFRQNMQADMVSPDELTASNAEALGLFPDTLINLCKTLEPRRYSKANSPRLRKILVILIPPAFNPSIETKTDFLNAMHQRFEMANLELKKACKTEKKGNIKTFAQLVNKNRPDLAFSLKLTVLTPDLPQFKLSGETDAELILFAPTHEAMSTVTEIKRFYTYLCKLEHWAFPNYNNLLSNLEKFIDQSYTPHRCFMTQKALLMLYTEYHLHLKHLIEVVGFLDPINDHKLLLRITLLQIVPENITHLTHVLDSLDSGITWMKHQLPTVAENMDHKTWRQTVVPLTEYQSLTLDSPASDIAKMLKKNFLTEHCEKQEQNFLPAVDKNIPKKTSINEDSDCQSEDDEPLLETENNWTVAKIICKCTLL